MRFRQFILSVIGAGLVSGLSFATVSAAPPATTTVTPPSLSASSWYFYDDTTDTPHLTQLPGTYEFALNPANGGLGNSSIKLTDNSATDRWDIATGQYAGTALSSIKALSFMTYQPNTNAGDPTNSIYLNFDVDFYSTTTNGYQGRLVYVPSVNGTVTQNTWQTWDTMPGMWTWSHYASNGNKWIDGNTSEYRSWSDIVAAFPSANVFHEANAPGQLVLRAGQPGPAGFVGYTDGLKIKINKDAVLYDFEFVHPTSPSDCRDNNWSTFANPSFANKHECIEYAQDHSNAKDKDDDSNRSHHDWWFDWKHFRF